MKKQKSYINQEHVEDIAVELDAQWVCKHCKAPLYPVYDNNGFSEPDPTHYEVIGYEYCLCQ